MEQNEQITLAASGKDPATVLKMKSGYVVMANSQFLPGYCLLLGFPQVASLSDLPLKQRNDYLSDMGIVGEAIEKVCSPRRINYAILGNKDPFLHAHIIPRYDWEAEALKSMPIWRYPDEVWADERYLFCTEKHGQLKADLAKKIKELMMPKIKYFSLSDQVLSDRR